MAPKHTDNNETANNVNSLTFCMPTVHAFDVSAVLSHYELHLTTPFTDAPLSTKDCIDDCSNFSSSAEAKLYLCSLLVCRPLRCCHV